MFGAIFFSFSFGSLSRKWRHVFGVPIAVLAFIVGGKNRSKEGTRRRKVWQGRAGRLMMRDEVDGRPAGPWTGVAGCLSGWELELEQTQVAVRYLLPSRSRGVAQLQTLAGQQSIDVVGRDERGTRAGWDWDAGWPGLRIWWILESGGHAAGAGDVIMRAVQGQQVGLGLGRSGAEEVHGRAHGVRTAPTAGRAVRRAPAPRALRLCNGNRPLLPSFWLNWSPCSRTYFLPLIKLYSPYCTCGEKK